MIYTEDRIDVRDLWLAIARKLALPKPDIYVVDQNINIEEILATKNDYQRILLYDVDKLSIDSVNKILNSNFQTTSVSFLGIQNPKSPIQPHIADLFSMAFLYNPEHHLTEIMDTLAITRQAEES